MYICKFYASTQAYRIIQWKLLKPANREIIPKLQATFQSKKAMESSPLKPPGP